MNSGDTFEVVHTTYGKSKNRKDDIKIETSVKGLIYRTEVYENGFLIDAKEVSCLDLSSVDGNEKIFKDRYLATHYDFEKHYFLEKVFKKVLSTEGKYINGEGKCVVNTYIFENVIKSEVLLDDVIIDTQEVEVDKKLLDEGKSFKTKYTKQHKDLVEENILVEKFPVNTFLNGILKKFPRYKQNPMHAFYFFVATVIIILWILSMVICGKAIPKIVKKVAGKEAGLVVKDMQKSLCIKEKKSEVQEEADKKETLYEQVYKNGYLFIPQKVIFKNNKEIKTIYIKNSIDGDLIVKVNNKIVDNLKSKLVTADMLIKILTPKNIIIKPEEIGEYEFKIENSFLNSNALTDGTYTGRIVFEVIKVRYNTTQYVTVDFEFNVDSSGDKSNAK